jgi:hypothetical protein
VTYDRAMHLLLFAGLSWDEADAIATATMADTARQEAAE